jgi:formyl-CoA transferase
MKLVEKADVVVENYRADVKFRLGIDYESLKKVNPRIILGSISGFGQDGPMPSARASTRSPRAWAASCGSPAAGRRPGARRHRRGRRGRGPALRHRHPDRAARAREVGAGPVGVELAAAGHDLDVRFPGGALDHRQGRAGPGRQQPSDRIPTGVFKTSDGYINIAASGDHIYKRFCESIKAPELLTDERFSSAKARVKHRDVLNAEIDKRMAPSPAPSGREAQQGRRAGRPIYKMDEMFADPQVKHLKMAHP